MSQYDDALCIKQHQHQFTKKLSNTEARLKKNVSYKKSVYLQENNLLIENQSGFAPFYEYQLISLV